MKKLATLALCAVSAMAVSAQTYVMKIHRTDGSVQLIKTTEVDKVDFEEYTEGAPDTPVLGEERMVDLGLSVKWAAWNMGATKPSEYGNFYAYGETEPKTEYTIDNYKWVWEDYEEGQFYETWEQYLMLGETITATNYDVAHVKWGDQWRMPTKLEWDELLNGCTWKWTAIDGVTGCLATSKVNGQSVFFPAAGNMVDANHTHDQLGCFYWTATSTEDFEEVRNHRANMDATYQSADGYDYPEVGFSVRAVYGPDPFVQPKYGVPSAPVDLGLSVKWAPCNLGGNPTALNGNYFCYGETAPKQYSHVYNYKFYDPLEDAYVNCGDNICGTEYDCATQAWGDDWRLPTRAEFEELVEKCTFTRSGYDLVVTGPNGNTMKLPAMGFMGYAGAPTGYLSPIDTGYYLSGETGAATWANGRPTDNEVCTMFRFQADKGNYLIYEYASRAMGVSVRPVYAK